MNHLVPIAFLAFVTVCAVTGIVADYLKRKASLEPLRAAIERGQQLDPALVERLIAPEKSSSGLAPMSLMVGGIVGSAAGVGVMILSVCLDRVDSSAFYPIMGAGIVVLCVGIGLMLAARFVERYRQRQATGANGR